MHTFIPIILKSSRSIFFTGTFWSISNNPGDKTQNLAMQMFRRFRTSFKRWPAMKIYSSANKTDYQNSPILVVIKGGSLSWSLPVMDNDLFVWLLVVNWSCWRPRRTTACRWGAAVSLYTDTASVYRHWLRPHCASLMAGPPPSTSEGPCMETARRGTRSTHGARGGWLNPQVGWKSVRLKS